MNMFYVYITEPEVFQDVDCTEDAECESEKPGSK